MEENKDGSKDDKKESKAPAKDFKRNYGVQRAPESKDMVFGIRPVEELFKSENEIEKMFFDKGQSNLQDLIREAKIRQIPHSFVPIEKLNSITRKNHQGVICFISPVRYQKLDNLLINIFEQGRIPLILVLDRITDVRNFGAIARTAEVAGVDAIVIPTRGSAQISADAVKTSSGALSYIPICREENLKTSLSFLKDSGLQLMGCTEKGGDYLFKLDFTGPLAIIMGSEEDGISDEYLKMCDHKVSIPMTGKVASLNVSVAAGVIIYEAIRQRM